jgi:hypothetical protein
LTRISNYAIFATETTHPCGPRTSATAASCDEVHLVSPRPKPPIRSHYLTGLDTQFRQASQGQNVKNFFSVHRVTDIRRLADRPTARLLTPCATTRYNPPPGLAGPLSSRDFRMRTTLKRPDSPPAAISIALRPIAQEVASSPLSLHRQVEGSEHRGIELLSSPVKIRTGFRGYIPLYGLKPTPSTVSRNLSRISGMR